MVDPVQGEAYGTERDAFVSEDRGLDPRRADDEGLELVAERFEEDVAGTGEAAPRATSSGASVRTRAAAAARPSSTGFTLPTATEQDRPPSRPSALTNRGSD